MHERGEDRFVHLFAPSYRLVMDLDDTRNKPYGEWYNDTNPLELEKIKPIAGQVQVDKPLEHTAWSRRSPTRA